MFIKSEKKTLRILFSFIAFITFLTVGGLKVNAETQESMNEIEKMYENLEPRSDRKVINAYLIDEPIGAQIYEVGETLSLAGLNVSVWYDDLSIEEVDWRDERIIAEGFDSSKVGSCVVRVFYQDENIKIKIHELMVTIEEPTRRGRGLLTTVTASSEDEDDLWYIDISSFPTKTVYLCGEELDLTGLKFELFFKGDNSQIIEYGDERISVVVSGYDNEAIGMQKILIRYQYGEYNFAEFIPVIFKENLSDKVVVKMVVVDYPEKWDEDDTETDWTHATFEVEYDDGSTAVLNYNSDNFYCKDLNDDGAVIYYYEDASYFDRFVSVSVFIIRKEIYDDNTINNKNKRITIDEDREILKQDIYDLSSINIPETYNLKKYLNITAGDQGMEGLCWDFASTKSLETNFYKKYGIGYDLSEKYADYLTSKKFYGDRTLGDGGDSYDYFNEMCKTGVPLEETVPYKNVSEGEYEALENSEKVVLPVSTVDFGYNSSMMISENKEIHQNLIKAHLMENGSVYCSVVWGGYDYSTNSFYYERGVDYSAGHAISIVGWDDHFSKDNFRTYNSNHERVSPKHDGAWIALNSWGEDFGDGNGLFYISYDTESIHYYGVLESEPYVEHEQYTYTRKIKNGRFDTIAEHKFFYIEYEKDDDIEYLTHIILPRARGIVKLYLLNNYQTINISKVKYLGDCLTNYYSDVFFMLDEPQKIEGDHFLIILECDDNYIEDVYYLRQDEDCSIHTYYTENMMSNHWKKYKGEIPLLVYTITEEQYEELQENKVDKINIKKNPNKLSYKQGENIDLTGGIIEVTYSNGRKETISMTNENVHYYGYTDFNKSFDNQTITVVYGGETDTFDISIRNDITGIEMYTLPQKLLYEYGFEDLDLSGGSVKVNYSDSSYVILDLNSNYLQIDDSEFDTFAEGTQTIRINYLDFTTQFQIEMPNTIIYWEVFELPDKLNYYPGEHIDLTGGKLKIVYADSSYEEWNMDDERLYLYQFVRDSFWGKAEDYEINSEFDEVGNYEFLVIPIPGNYSGTDIWSVTVKRIPDSREQVLVPILGGASEYTYNGGMYVNAIAGFDPDLMTMSGELSAAYAGVYDVVFTLKDTENYVWHIGSDDYGDIVSDEEYILTWRILPRTTWAYIKSQKKIQYDYTGDELEWTGELIEFNERIHRLENYKQTNAGIYEAILALKDERNYQWGWDESMRKQEWEIKKSVPNIQVSNNVQEEGKTSPIEVMVTPALTDGQIEIRYVKSGDDDYSLNFPNRAGMHEAIVLVKNDSNLEDTSISTELVIKQAKLKGDVDWDEEITVIDIRLLLQAIVNQSWNREEIPILDINNDDSIDILDVRELLQAFLNLKSN